MKAMKKKIGILGVAALLFVGCYEDKGNYDYHDINDVLAVTFSPAPDRVTEDSVYTYTYPMSSEDTMFLTFTPTVTQSQAADESQLEFQWIFEGTNSYDTVFSRELTLAFPFQELVTYEPLFRLIDHSTGIEYYRSFDISTREAYINSWYALHGAPGDRRIGVAEISDDGEVTVTEDAYEVAFGVRRFQNAEGMYYSSYDLMSAMPPISADNEKLMIYEADSCTQLAPFSFVQRKTYREMIYPNRPLLPIAEGIDDEMGNGQSVSSVILRLADGSCYWSRSNTMGYYFSVKADNSIGTYHADKVFIPRGVNGSPDPYMLIWDDTRKQFFHYQMPALPMLTTPLLAHPGDDAYDSGKRVKAVPEDAFEEGELDDMEVLAMVLSSTDGKTGVVFHNTSDDSYWYYDMGFEGMEGVDYSFNVTRTQLVDLGINENSLFATSYEFPDQIFFTVNGDVCLYNITSDAVNTIYTVSGEITDMRFAVSRSYFSYMYPENLNFRLGLAVQTADGQGEIHDLRLGNSGDVNESYVCTGFGPIVDLVFAVRNRLF